MKAELLKKNKYPILVVLVCSLILIGASTWPKSRLTTLNMKLKPTQVLPQCPQPRLKKTKLDLSDCGRLLYLATHGLCFTAPKLYKSHWIVFKNDIEAYTSLCSTLTIRHQRGQPLFH